MYCIVCGTKNPEYAKFCFNCGTKLVQPAVEAEPVKFEPVTVMPPAEHINTPSDNNHTFSISADDLADFNPFLFKDDDESFVLPIAATASTSANSDTKRNGLPIVVETKVNPEPEMVKAVQPGPAVLPYTQNTQTSQPLPPTSNPTANPYGFNSNSPRTPSSPDTNLPTNQPPTNSAPPPYTYNPYIGQPPTNPASPPYNRPNIGQSSANPYNYNPNFMPAPPPRPLIAPNGLPYAVVDHPNSFYNYKTKDGKGVYASYSEVWQRLLGSAIDAAVILVPFFLILLVYLLLLGPTEMQKWLDASNTGDIAVTETYLPHWITLLLYLVYLAYTTLLTAHGQTLGKRIVRLKVITLAGTPPDLRTSLLRNLFGFAFVLGGYIAYYPSPLTGLLGQGLEVLVGIGFALILFDPRRQGWHDKLAGTVVVKNKELVEGVDFPAKGQV